MTVWNVRQIPPALKFCLKIYQIPSQIASHVANLSLSPNNQYWSCCLCHCKFPIILTNLIVVLTACLAQYNEPPYRFIIPVSDGTFVFTDYSTLCDLTGANKHDPEFFYMIYNWNSEEFEAGNGLNIPVRVRRGDMLIYKSVYVEDDECCGLDFIRSSQRAISLRPLMRESALSTDSILVKRERTNSDENRDVKRQKVNVIDLTADN